jgi:hypothetical protein
VDPALLDEHRVEAHPYESFFSNILGNASWGAHVSR